MAADWLSRLGRKGFVALLSGVVDKVLQNRIEPRLVGVENRLAAIESRLDVADRLANLEQKRLS